MYFARSFKQSTIENVFLSMCMPLKYQTVPPKRRINMHQIYLHLNFKTKARHLLLVHFYVSTKLLSNVEKQFFYNQLGHLPSKHWKATSKHCDKRCSYSMKTRLGIYSYSSRRPWKTLPICGPISSQLSYWFESLLIKLMVHLFAN